MQKIYVCFFIIFILEVNIVISMQPLLGNFIFQKIAITLKNGGVIQVSGPVD